MPGVDDLRVGDEVFGFPKRDGTALTARRSPSGAAIVAKKPAGLSHVEAAAMALIGLTAPARSRIRQAQGRRDDPDPGRRRRRRGFRRIQLPHIGARVITTTGSAANLDYPGRSAPIR